MEDTRTLSPEIIGLFNKVQSQAEEYGKAFDLLEKSRKEFDTFVFKLTELEENVRRNSEIAISQINTNTLESIILLKNKTDETLKLSINLGDIAQFKKSLESLKTDLTNLQSKLTKQGEELEASLRYFKKKSEMDLDSTLLNVKTKLDKEIQAEGQKIELRLNLRMKQNESIFISFDERIKALENKTTSAIKRLSLDMDLLKHGYSYDDSNNITHNTDLPELEDISNRLSAVEIMLSGLSEKVADYSPPQIIGTKSVSDNKITEMGKKVTQLISQIKAFENHIENATKPSAGSGLAIAAVLLSLAAIAIAFLF